MIYRLFFPPIQLIQKSFLFHKGNEVSVNLALNLSLSLFYRFLMFFANISVGFEPLSDFLRCFPQRFFSKFVKVTVFFHEIWVLVHLVHDDMKKSDCPTCIFCILFHVEYVFTHFVVLETSSFLLFVASLKLVDLEKEDDSEYRLAEHFLSPLLSRQEILN